MSPEKILNLIGALFGAAGTFLMYKGTYGFAPSASYMGSPSQEAAKANAKRARLQKCGLLLLMASFVLQAVAQLMPSQ